MSDRTDTALEAGVREAFREEAVELLRRVEVAISGLAGQDAASRHESCRHALRAFHTLKGAAAASGEEAIEAIAHELEDRLRAVADAREVDPALLAELDRAMSQLHASISVLVASSQGDEPRPRSIVPAEVEAPNETHAIQLAPAAPAAAAASGPAGLSAGNDALRIRADRIDTLHALVGELTVARLREQSYAVRLGGVRDELDEAVERWRRFASRVVGRRKNAGSTAAVDDIATSVRRMNEGLAAAVREVTAIAREASMLQAQSSALVSSIEDGVRELRLMPLQPFFEEYAKVVREVARASGKQARLAIRAEGAEIDRAVVMQLRDPLLHLIRNAVAHGIETPAQRDSAGKDRTGTVMIEARCDGPRATIRVVDDGAGVDLEGVRDKAVRLGILSSGATLTADEALDLITRPGFSTREHADEVAGRGIGLDVVASVVRDLDGRLDLESMPGGGTSFAMDVPISAATSIGLTLCVGVHTFTVLLGHVERVLRVLPADIRTGAGPATVLVADDPLAVVTLSELMGFDTDAPLEASSRIPAVVLRAGKQRLVVLVDDIPGEQPVVVKPLGRSMSRSRFFTGGAVQSDGSILPVLNVTALFETATRATRRGAARTGIQVTAKVQQRGSVLVVDDSMTMRTLLRNILRAAGYDVTVAHNGRSALEALRALPACDLLITDFQMPGMDGVELCTAVRGSERAHMPIIMVTSVADALEKRRAMEAGADSYIVKSEFEQAGFLSLVARVAGRSAAVA